MNILWIVSSGWKEGGVENYLVLMRPLLEKQGHVVKILASDDRPDMPHFNDYSYRTPSGFFRYLFYSFNPSAYREVKKILREFKPDIVHIHSIGHASPGILFPLHGYPTVLTVHGPDGFVKDLIAFCLPASDFKHCTRDIADLTWTGKLRYAYHRYLNAPLYAYGFRNVHTIISPSQYMQNLIGRTAPLNMCIPNGTTLFDYRPLRPEEITHTILYSGRLETYKGVHILLHAMPKVLSRFSDTRLIIAGDGTGRAHLEHLVDTLAIRHAVHFLGHIDHGQLQELYTKATVIVMPSTSMETFGLVGIEAMSVGRPVVASRVGGIPEWLVHEKTGFLVPPGDADALAHALIELYANHPLLLSMMSAARTRAEEFALEPHINALLDTYVKTMSIGKKL